MLLFSYVSLGLILGIFSLRWGDSILDQKEAFDHLVWWAMCWPFLSAVMSAKFLYAKLRRLF